MNRLLLPSFVLLLGLTVSTAQAAPNVVASIKPGHSLVASDGFSENPWGEAPPSRIR